LPYNEVYPVQGKLSETSNLGAKKKLVNAATFTVHIRKEFSASVVDPGFVNISFRSGFADP
jgi:hypothetical protein